MHKESVRIPNPGLGTYPLKEDEACRSVLDGLEAGFRHIDTAQDYGNEASVGRAVRQCGLPRSEVFVVTKVAPPNARPEKARRSIDESLKALSIDYIDLLLIHWPSWSVPAGQTFEIMQEFVERDLVRHLGLSNFTVQLIEGLPAWVRDTYVCNQVEAHVLFKQHAMHRYLSSHGKALVAYSPLAKGAVAEHPAVRAIADAIARTPGQVGLRYLIQKGMVPTPKSSSRTRAAENLAARDFELSTDHMSALDAVADGPRLVSPWWSPPWDD
jgi:2,5-diketo-D-gluconate reductase B